MFSKLVIDYVELINVNFYKIIFKPFICEKFICNTILNLLKHFIFTTNTCCRVTEVCFKNKTNEYSYLPGVKEDVLNIILNLKNLIFKIKKKKVFLKLKSNNNIVKASDIKLKKNVKILNPDYVICNLNKGFKINLILKIEKIDNLNKSIKTIPEMKNGIIVKARSSAIIKCFYNISDNVDSIFENVKNINFYIETDGSIDGKNIFIKSLNNYLNIFHELKKNKFLKKCENNYINIDIINCGFSFKTVKLLYDLNICDLKSVLKYDLKYFINSSHFTIKTISEIKKVFKKL